MQHIITSAMSLCLKAHAGQTDKAGAPYYLHPLGVALLLRRDFPDADDDEVAAGLLHDVVEDAGITCDDLVQAGFPAKTVRIVQLVTRVPGVTYKDFIRSIAEADEPGAIRVKLSDLRHNTLPHRLESLSPEDRARLCKRYDAAKIVLEEALATKVTT